MLFKDKTKVLITLMVALMVLSGILLLGASVLLFTHDSNETVRASGPSDDCWFTLHEDTEALDSGIRYRVIELNLDTLVIEDEFGGTRLSVARDQGTLSGACGE